MACIIYREGKGTTEHGIECESTTCEIEHLEGLLANGWSQNPPGYEPPEPVVAEEEEADEPEEDEAADLEEQVASLSAQLEIMAEMDEKSQAEIVRLNEELEKADADLQALAQENIELRTLINAVPEEPPVTDEESSDSGDDESANLHPVRIAAKEAGIEGWETKRIATLQAALDSLKDGQGE